MENEMEQEDRCPSKCQCLVQEATLEENEEAHCENPKLITDSEADVEMSSGDNNNVENCGMETAEQSVIKAEKEDTFGENGTVLANEKDENRVRGESDLQQEIAADDRKVSPDLDVAPKADDNNCDENKDRVDLLGNPKPNGHHDLRLPVDNVPERGPLPVHVTNFFIDDILRPDFGRAKTTIIQICDPFALHRVSTEERVVYAGRGDPCDEKLNSVSRFPVSKRSSKKGSHSTSRKAESTHDDHSQETECGRSSPSTPSGHQPIVWPAWVYCTRYSDRPSSGPRSRKIRRKDRKPDEKRPRTAFTNEQLKRLKDEFDDNRYLTEERRQKLAKELGLNESQIKIWFQNKRAKMKKSSGVRNSLALQLMAQGLYNHATVSVNGQTQLN